MADLKQIPHPALLWHSGYWDGPTSGMCVVDGERLWFEMVDETADNDRFRTFHVYRLTPEQLAQEDLWHAAFREHVGTHTDYVDGKREVGNGVKPQTSWEGFYKPYGEAVKARPKRAPEQAVAWFDDRPVAPAGEVER